MIPAPDHVPVEELRTEPTAAVPDSVGSEVFTGPPLAPATTAVAADSAVTAPSALVAVTAIRIVIPTSVVVNRYVLAAAPAMSTQALPAVLQRRHW